jgi:predicted small integral membrane protein
MTAMSRFFYEELQVASWNTVCEPGDPLKGFLYFQPIRGDSITPGLIRPSLQLNTAYLALPVDIVFRKAYWSEAEANEGTIALQLNISHSIPTFSHSWIESQPEYNTIKDMFTFWRVLDNGAAKSFEVSTQTDSDGNRIWFADFNVASYVELIIGLNSNGSHRLK